MPQDLSISGSAHPAPQRGNTHQGALWFSVVAAPLGWAAHLLVNYSIAGQNCLGAADIDGMARPDGRLTAILLIDLAAILLAIIAGYIAFQRWLDTRTEKGGGAHHLVHSGEGRTRFLAMCGILTSALFGFAVVIDAIGSILGPPC
jgi:hypothetical protein